MADFWFGNLSKAGYFPAPVSGMDAGHVGETDMTSFSNGGAYVTQSGATHRTFDLSWSIEEKQKLQRIVEYRNGDHGDGLLYMVDPFATNVLPPHWAKPSLTCKDWPSLVGPASKPKLAPAALITNIATNPSMEAQGGNISLRTNLAKNPVPNSPTGWLAPWSIVPTVFSNNNPCVQISATSPGTGYIFSDSAQGTFAVGETIQLSMDAEFPDGYPATTWRAHSKTGNVYYEQGAVVLPAQPSGNEVIRASVTFVVPAGVTIPANDLDLSMVTTGTPTTNARARFGRLLIEKSTNRDEYFSGDTTTLNMARNPVGANTVGWSPNNSVVHERQFGVPTADHPKGITTAVSSGPLPGANTTVVASFYNIDGLGVGSTRKVAGAWFKALSDNQTLQAAYGWPATPLPRNRWVWVSSIGPVNATQYGVSVLKTSGNATVDDRVLITGLTVHDYTTPFRYESAGNDDFEILWTGAAGNSTSLMRAPTVAGVGGGAAAAYSSSIWSRTGPRSLRVSSRYPTEGSAYADIMAMYSGKLVPGRRYTVQVVAHREVAGSQPATLLYMPYNGAAALGTTSATMGATEMDKILRISFMVPPTTTVEYLRLYNTQPQGSPDVWFDDLQIVEGDYSGPYFDGSTEFLDGTAGSWTGPVNASTSTLARTPGNMPNEGAEYTLDGEIGAVPQRKLTLLVPEDRTLWLGFTGTSVNGGAIRMRGITTDGAYGPVTAVPLLNPSESTRLNVSVAGSQYRAVQLYLTNTQIGSGRVTLVSGKAVYSNIGETPILTGDHLSGEGHTGFRIGDVAMSYIQAADGHQYVTAATKATEMEAWL